MKNYSNILLIAHNKLWFMLLNEWNSFDCYLRNWCVVIKKGVCFHSCLTMLVYSLHPSVQMIWEVFSGMVQLKTSLVSRMICQGWHFRDLEGFKECESSPSIPKGLGWWSVIWNSSETVQLSAQGGSGAFGKQMSHVLIVKRINKKQMQYEVLHRCRAVCI